MSVLEVKIVDYTQGPNTSGSFMSPAEVVRANLEESLKLVQWAEVEIEISGEGHKMFYKITKCPDVVRRFVEQKLASTRLSPRV